MAEILSTLVMEKRLEYRHSQSLHFSLDTGPEGVKIRTDPVELLRALSNLINNSAEAIGFHGKIEIGLRVIKDSQVEIYVQDFGPGLPPEVLSEFGTRGKSTKPCGNGLGLFQVRQFAEAHGIVVRIASQPNQGTIIGLLFKNSGEFEK